MKCGHVSQGRDKDGRPACKICYPSEDSLTIVKIMPNLLGRKAKCTTCGKIVKSDFALPFFKYIKYAKYDKYYCGCKGWD